MLRCAENTGLLRVRASSLRAAQARPTGDHILQTVLT